MRIGVQYFPGRFRRGGFLFPQFFRNIPAGKAEVLVSAGIDFQDYILALGSIYHPDSGIAQLTKGLRTQSHQWFFEVAEVVGAGKPMVPERMGGLVSEPVNNGDSPGLFCQTTRQIGKFIYGVDKCIIGVGHTNQENFRANFR